MAAGREAIYEPLASPKGAWAAEHLAIDVVGWLTTVAADGRVQSSPISFLWDGESILFYSKPATPKLRNIAAHPQVSFNLNSDAYADHMLAIEGIAAVDDSVPPSDVHPAMRRSTTPRWRTGRCTKLRRPVSSRCWSGSRPFASGPGSPTRSGFRFRRRRSRREPSPLEHPPGRQADQRVAPPRT